MCLVKPYIEPGIWNSKPEISKRTNNLNIFLYSIKKYYLNDLSNPYIKYMFGSVFAP